MPGSPQIQIHVDVPCLVKVPLVEKDIDNALVEKKGDNGIEYRHSSFVDYEYRNSSFVSEKNIVRMSSNDENVASHGTQTPPLVSLLLRETPAASEQGFYLDNLTGDVCETICPDLTINIVATLCGMGECDLPST